MKLEIEQSLRNDRKLRESSIKTYKSPFNKVAKEFDIEVLSQDWLKENVDKVLEWVESQKHGSKIAVYSSLLVLLSPKQKKQADPKFVEIYDRTNLLLKTENASYQDMKSSQENTPTEANNWVAWSSIQKLYAKI